MDKDNGFEYIDLPSKGECYPATSPLRNGKIAVGYLTASDEDIICNPKIYEEGDLVDIIIDRRIIDKSIDSSMLCMGDRDAITLWLRRTGYGNEFPVYIRTHDEQSSQWETTIDLSKVINRDFQLSGDENGHFMYFMENGDMLKYRFLSAKEVNSVYQDTDDDKTTIIEMLKAITVSINGNNNKIYISQYINGMNDEDAMLYITYVHAYAPSIENHVNVDIPKEYGGGKTVIKLQINSDFFLNV